MVPSVQKKLFQHVDEHIAFYVGAWKQLYEQLSNTVQYANSQKILEAVIAQLQQRGIQAQILSEQIPLIYGELPAGAAHTLLFYHRYDMHAPNLQELEAIAALLSALEVCKKVSGLVAVNIKWLLDGSGKDYQELSRSLEEHSDRLQADACIWNYAEEAGFGEDGTPILALGTKGRLSTELEVQTANTAIDVMHGAIAPNALWRLLWALNSLKDAQEDVKIEGFYDTLTSAQDDATLYTLPENAHILAQRWGLQQLLMDLKGFQLHYAHLLMPMCTVTGITSNTTEDPLVAAIPAQAKAWVDFHLVPDQDPQDIFAKLQQHLQLHGFQDVRARMLHGIRPTITPIGDPFVQVVTQATEKAFEQTPALLPITVGSYPLYPLQMKSSMPIVLIARNKQVADGSRKTFATTIKQIALIIEETAYAN
jgi:hypothetical protein